MNPWSPPGLAGPASPPLLTSAMGGSSPSIAHPGQGHFRACKTQGKKNSPAFADVSKGHLRSLHPLGHPFSSGRTAAPASCLSSWPLCCWRKSSQVFRLSTGISQSYSAQLLWRHPEWCFRNLLVKSYAGPETAVPLT